MPNIININHHIIDFGNTMHLERTIMYLIFEIYMHQEMCEEDTACVLLFLFFNTPSVKLDPFGLDLLESKYMVRNACHESCSH